MSQGPKPLFPLRVLQLIGSLPVGGAEDLVAAIATGLDPSRFQVQVATIGPAGPVGEELLKAKVPVVSLGLDFKHTSSFGLVLAVRRLLKEMQPHILHTHLYHPNLYGRLGAWGLGLPGVVASVHNTYTKVKFHRRLWNFLLALGTHRILVSSPQVWQDVRDYDWVNPARLEILPYGIRLEELEVAVSREAAREVLGVRGFCLGVVGRLEEQKGHRFLLEALPHIRREVHDLTVLLVGSGREEEALRRQAQELEVQELVRFLGTRRDLPLIFRALDLFVQPSLWEGLPLALLKAMGSGLAVVATQVSGVSDVITNGLNGFMVLPGDSMALARSIMHLASHPELRRQMGTAARHTVAVHYSLPAMLRRLEALYLDLVKRSAGKKQGLWRLGGRD